MTQDSGQWPSHPPYAQPGYPQPGYPPPAYQQPRSTDGFAIASLVLAVVGPPLFGAVFGIVALRRIKRSGNGGRGLAIGGIVVSIGYTVVVAGIIAAVVLTGTTDRFLALVDPPVAPRYGTVDVDEVGLGDCIKEWPDDQSEVKTVERVDCAGPHGVETYQVFDVDDAQTYPGSETIYDTADTRCETALGPELTEALGTDIDWGYLYPTSASWALGDRKVTCLLIAMDEPFVGYRDTRLG